MPLIGREKEIQVLENALQSTHSELIVVYGRRRVGKTYLIRETYKKQLRFEFTGMYKATTREQLKLFQKSLFDVSSKKLKAPTNWLDAFQQLKDYCETLTGKGKKVLFIDEFPWLDNNKSSFLKAFDNFWNTYVTKREDIVVVICGSAAAYMINKIIRSKGGLHNRLTDKIRVEPFSLQETELLLKKNRVKLARYDILLLYMVMGGIPHYLERVKAGESVVQAIDRLCFEKDGFLRNEFKNVFASLFDQVDNHETIIRLLADVRKGLSRNAIMKKGNFPSGGNLTRTLHELEESGFIEQYAPYKGNNNALYRLKDEYCNFYIKYIEKNKPSKNGVWNKLQKQQSFNAWAGFTFETICLKHIEQIKEGLKIAGIYTTAGNWLERNSENGVQIDLLIDRDDNVINLCEIKFYDSLFTLNKKYASELMHKEAVFRDASQTKKSIFLTLITVHGIVENEYSRQLIQNNLTLEHLFL
ncbi:MAG: ATP-binding protein [Flavobacteriales bacterium]|nr:ATP-binding protein [Flavobacteriales bacterium]